MKVRNISGCECFDELGNQVALEVSTISERFVQYDLINFAV